MDRPRREASVEISLLTPSFWTSCLLNHEKINVYCLSQFTGLRNDSSRKLIHRVTPQ